MTTVARKFVSVPERTAMATWKAISGLLASDPNSAAAAELASISGIAASLITRQAMKDSSIVVYGSGPRVRIYCLYNEEALEGDDASENPLAFDATAGDWKMSLPCPADDLAWVERALRGKTSRITARDMDTSVEEGDAAQSAAVAEVKVDLEAFFKS